MMERFVQSLSTYSGDVDNLIVLVTLLVGFWFLLAEGMFFWLIWRFRARDGVKAQYITGNEKHLKAWINNSHWLIIICDIVIIVAAVQVWYRIKQTLPPADATVRVTGQQWVWTFQHPGADGKLDTADDIRTTDDMHVEVGKTYHFQLESKDVLHSFFIPVFRLKQDAIPGRTIVGWFKATRPGEHDILCAEMCGIGHGVMGARILIETPEQHVAWVQTHTAVAEETGETPVDPAAAESVPADSTTTTTPAH